MRKGRPEAARNLVAAVEEVRTRLKEEPAGLPAPRPYPEFARPGRAWVHAGHYWFVYATTQPPVILAVFHDQADIPGRFEPLDRP